MPVMPVMVPVMTKSHARRLQSSNGAGSSFYAGDAGDTFSLSVDI